MSQPSEITLRITRDQRLAEEWELVLLAEGFSPTVRHGRDGLVVRVPEKEAGRAQESLFAYESETAATQQDREEATGLGNWRAGLVAGGALLAFFVLTVLWKPATPWFESGSADAFRIQDGEVWRAVTALTLHADAVHALANAVAAALFVGVASGSLGWGLGGALILLSGVGGNLANAFVRASPHVSIGASTAVFGAVGMLGGLAAARRRKAMGGRGAWVPVAAALALLAMLGSGGERIDIGAHLFGFMWGGGLGILFGFVTLYPRKPWIQWVWGGGALVLIGCSWTRALH